MSELKKPTEEKSETIVSSRVFGRVREELVGKKNGRLTFPLRISPFAFT